MQQRRAREALRTYGVPQDRCAEILRLINLKYDIQRQCSTDPTVIREIESLSAQIQEKIRAMDEETTRLNEATRRMKEAREARLRDQAAHLRRTDPEREALLGPTGGVFSDEED